MRNYFIPSFSVFMSKYFPHSSIPRQPRLYSSLRVVDDYFHVVNLILLWDGNVQNS
jgi:hypothetical protein